MLDNYERVFPVAKGRPVVNASHALDVCFGMNLVQLTHIDEDNIASIVVQERMVS